MTLQHEYNIATINYILTVGNDRNIIRIKLNIIKNTS